MASPYIHIRWEGASGNKYGYRSFPIGTAFKDMPGNYVYAKEISANTWAPVYIGQTSSLQDRLADHEKEECATRNGATHVHAHINNAGEAARLGEEADLVEKWTPVCNG